ncbi:hypothetical protein FRB98_000601 [Tulasnella sp. 332]|nr:hypothetical protein FRB98_000601 [Tulasnella sp. 332]
MDQAKNLTKQEVILPSIVHDRQRKANEAGLIVTDEWEKAAARCKAKVARLAAECLKGNRQFRDIEFDLIEDREQCLHAMDTSRTKYTPADIRRVGDIFVQPQFFVGGATASDISQGFVDDCWFLSALAMVATTGLIEKICVARNEKAGIYGFLFWRDSGWVDVIIDDLLYTCVPRWEALSTREQMIYQGDKARYDSTARKGSKNIYFAKSLTTNETWVPLLEYEYILAIDFIKSLRLCLTDSHPYLERHMRNFTATMQVFKTATLAKDILDPEQFWNEEIMRVGTDRLFGCFTQPLSLVVGEDKTAPARAPSTNGLVAGHAYSILKAVEFKGRKFLRFGDLGQFVMEYSDFLTTWGVIERTRLFGEDWTLGSQWLQASGGSYLTPWNYGDVCFIVKVEKPTAAVFVLAQLDIRYFEELSGHYRWSLDFTIFPKSSEPQEPLAHSIHSNLWSRSVKTEVDLPYAGEYVVHARLDRSSKRSKEWFTENVTTWQGRKYSRKSAEYVLSKAICANFDPQAQGVTLRLLPETYAKESVTELELKALQEIADLRATKKAAFPGTTEAERSEAPEGRGHEGWSCNGCRGPLPVTRWTCMDVTCLDFDLCEGCHKSGGHNPNHVLMPVHFDVDDATVRGDWEADGEDGNKVVIGLRVYTKRDAPATVSGQLRHGNTVRESIMMSKVF